MSQSRRMISACRCARLLGKQSGGLAQYLYYTTVRDCDIIPNIDIEFI